MESKARGDLRGDKQALTFIGMGARFRDGRPHGSLSRWERARVRVVPKAAPRLGFPHPDPLREGVGA